MDSGAIDISPDGPLPSALPTTVTDFVRKLHDMLEDHANENLVCWGPQNDCFIVKDINKFSISVLPQVFNHSNFASFVRQLNKYDFHKLKQGEKEFSVFYHQHFHRDRPQDFQHIKRKVKSAEPTEPGSSSSDFIFSDNAEPLVHSAVHHMSSSAYGPASLPSPATMEKIVEDVTEVRDQLWGRIQYLEKNTGFIQSELVRMKDQMGQNNAIIETLRNRMGSSTELGKVTPGPPFSTPIITMDGTRNVPSSGLNRTSGSLTSGNDSVSGRDTEEMATRPSADFHGISFPPSINTRHRDSTFGSQSTSGEPSRMPVTLPVSAGQNFTAMDPGLLFTPTHGWSDASSQGGLSLQESQEILQGMEIRRPGQNIDDASSGLSHRPNSSPALFLPKPRGLGTLHNTDIPTIGFDGQLGRRGRSFSLDHRARFHVEALTSVESRRQVRRQSSNVQSSMYAFAGSSGEDMVFQGEHNLRKEYDSTSQGELRRSDGRGAVYGQTDDRGAGAVSQNVDPQPAPFPASGRWSFDTSTVATDGMLHGLGIAIGGPHPTNTSDADLVDCDSDTSHGPAMLESD